MISTLASNIIGDYNDSVKRTLHALLAIRKQSSLATLYVSANAHKSN